MPQFSHFTGMRLMLLTWQICVRLEELQRNLHRDMGCIAIKLMAETDKMINNIVKK